MLRRGGGAATHARRWSVSLVLARSNTGTQGGALTAGCRAGTNCCKYLKRFSFMPRSIDYGKPMTLMAAAENTAAIRVPPPAPPRPAMLLLTALFRLAWDPA